MARLVMEGFEAGFPNNLYIEDRDVQPPINGWYFSGEMTNKWNLAPGCNAYSTYSIRYSNIPNSSGGQYMWRYLDKLLDEFYVSFKVKFDANYYDTDSSGFFQFSYDFGNYDVNFTLWTDINGILWLNYDFNDPGTPASVNLGSMQKEVWHKIDVHYKRGTLSTGAYEVKMDNVSLVSATGLTNKDTSSDDNDWVVRFKGWRSTSGSGYIQFDDIFINDTTGGSNNSWIGEETITGLKPKGAGNKAQWTLGNGWGVAEAGTNTTTLKLTAHGLATNDVIYNETRNAYAVVTKSDNDTLTMSAITGQTSGDIIYAYTYQSTVTATTGTSTSQIVTSTNGQMEAGDVFVNTSRSNAIRKVQFVLGYNTYVNSYSSSYYGTLGSTVTSQASGDSIKTFKPKYYSKDHYDCVNDALPNVKKCNIQSASSSQIDTYDMQELNADKGTGTSVAVTSVAISVSGRDIGVGGSKIKPVFRIGSTDYEGSERALSLNLMEYKQIYDTSPATSSNWTRAEVDGLEAGVKKV